MTNKDKIIEALRGLTADMGICDDCLVVSSGVRPRNQVNIICHKLEAEGAVTRRHGNCKVRHSNVSHISEKELNYRNSGVQVKPEESRSRSKDGAPNLEIQTNLLSQWLFDATSFMNQLENVEGSREPFAARAARLKREERVSATLSAVMQLLNTYRVQVVKERKLLPENAWQLVNQSISNCRLEWEDFRLDYLRNIRQ